MKQMKKLPDAEFDIMKVVWANEPPVTTNIIMEQLGTEKSWKAPDRYIPYAPACRTWIFKHSKRGKERIYYPLISKDEYLKFETSNFMKQYHDNSFLDLVNTLYEDKALTDKDIDELLQWAKKRRD